MKIKDTPEFTRPREKLIERGPSTLSDPELLAILIRTGFQGKNAIEVAKLLLTDINLKDLGNISVPSLSKMKGIGVSRATSILAAAELGRRMIESEELPTVKTTTDVLQLIHFIRNKSKEHSVALYLDARQRLIKMHTISIGILDATIMHPRETFVEAIRNNASKILLAHNHPSGDPTPSDEDIKMTERLKLAGEILHIPVLDHIIVSKTKHFSLKEHNLM